MINRLVRKLSNYVDLPEDERKALDDLSEKQKSVAAHTDLVCEDGPTAGGYLSPHLWQRPPTA